jgi:uncharacterized protein YukE
MADTDPLSQMFNLFAAPLAGAVQSFDQFRKGVDQFQRGVENFNRTMETLNETAGRINVLLAEVEEPLRAAVPQVTRSVKAADDMMRVVAGPAMAVAPGLQILAETLNNPAFKQMPQQISQMNDVLADVTARLAPLGQIAESAGGLFGGLKLPGFGGAARATPATTSTPPASAIFEPAASPSAESDPDRIKKTAARKRAAAKKTPAKKTATRTKSAAKKS